MKRFLSLLLALVLVLSVFPAPSFAEEYLIEDISVIEEVVPEEITPEEIVPEEVIQEEIVSEEVIQEEAVPVKSVPTKAASGETAPVLTAEADPVSGGGILTWEAVEGAEYYKVYRASSKSGSYKHWKTVEKTRLRVSVSVGSSRYYKIKAVYDDGDTGKYSNYVRVNGVCAQPEFDEVYARVSNGKPYLDWDKVSGAKKYYVYSVNEDGTKTRLTSTTKTSYTHTKAKVGETYTYVVRAIASSSSRNSIYSQEVTCTAKLPRPVLKISRLSSSGKPELDWNNITGAVGYQVWREEEDKRSVLLAEVTKSSFVDETAVVDVEYEYEIVAVAANPKANSAPSDDRETTPKCARPVASAQLVDKKPMITWDEVDGAVKYYVYRSTSKNGTYKKIGTVYADEGESYHNTSAKKNTTYYYKIVAVSRETRSSYSSYVKIKSK